MKTRVLQALTILILLLLFGVLTPILFFPVGCRPWETNPDPDWMHEAGAANPDWVLPQTSVHPWIVPGPIPEANRAEMPGQTATPPLSPPARRGKGGVNK